MNFHINNFHNGTNAQIENSVNNLRAFAKNQPYEWSMNIAYGDGDYFISRQKGNLLNTNMSYDRVSFEFNENTSIVVHTHPNSLGNLTSPSALDVITLGKSYKHGAINIYSNVIIAYDGSEYAVYINDKTIFTNFISNKSNDSFFENNGANFKSGSVWANEYENAYNNLTNQGFSPSIANSYALTYVLDKFETGIKIAERESSSNSFSEQKTEQINNNYQPTKCP